MYLEIVSPEATLLSTTIDSVAVPSLNGEFQMLNHHAPIITILGEGVVKVVLNAESNIDFDDLSEAFEVSTNKTTLKLGINSGTIESRDNKVIVLVE